MSLEFFAFLPGLIRPRISKRTRCDCETPIAPTATKSKLAVFTICHGKGYEVINPAVI